MLLKLVVRKQLLIYIYHTIAFTRYINECIIVDKSISVHVLFKLLAGIAVIRKNAPCLTLTLSVIQSLRTHVFVQPTTWKYLQFARVSIYRFRLIKLFNNNIENIMLSFS